MKVVYDLYDKAIFWRFGAGLQSRLPYLSLRTVGLDDSLENYSKGVNIFSQAIDKEEGIDVMWFRFTSTIVILIAETSPV